MLTKTHHAGVIAILAATVFTACANADSDARQNSDWNDADRSHPPRDADVQLGSRPFYLIDGMDAGPLKEKLQGC